MKQAKIARCFLAGAGMLGLAACQSGTVGSSSEFQTATPELAAQWGTGSTVSMTQMQQTGKFQGSPRLRQWLQNARAHRALAVGSPDRCGFAAVSKSEASEAKARLEADKLCLRHIADYSAYAGTNCNCRIALVNQTITAPPSAFARFGVYKMIVERPDGGRRTLRGTAEVSGNAGENNPVRMLDRTGQMICTGNYAVTGRHADTGAGQGSFSLDCTHVDGTAMGQISVVGANSSRPAARGEGRFPDGTQIRFALGALHGTFNEFARDLQ